MCLIETEADFEFQGIDLARKEQHSASFLRLQPYGKVPVWEERGGFTMFESRAIMKHVSVGSSLFPLPFSPSLSHITATIEMWISVEQSYFQAAWVPIFQERILKKRSNPKHVVNEILCKEKAIELEKVLDQMEVQLRRTGEYIAGDTFTIADVTFLPYFSLFEQAGLKGTLKERPFLAGWVSRCLGRRAWKYVADMKVLDRVEK